MTNEKVQPKVKDLQEPEMPEQVAPRVQEMQVGAVVQPILRTTPGRKPLFRN